MGLFIRFRYPPPVAIVNVRYMVEDVEAAVAFYTTHFGFTVLSKMLPAFADVQRGELRLLLSGPESSAGRPMPDGTRPGPGGWNRFELVVQDIDAEVKRLRAAGVTFRNENCARPGWRADSCFGSVGERHRVVPAGGVPLVSPKSA